ncbi:MAG: LacI family DNA-binding transcriptional regulator [Anaerolineae bacterium]
MARVNIKDVADMAGVSTATVSHVINGTRFVREETRRKVLEIVEALNYHPSSIARGLATNSTQTIGLIISDITNPFFTAVARGVEDEINQHGYHTIFCNTDEDPPREDEYLRLLFAHQIDGLIIAPAGTHSERLIRMAEDVPIVLLDRQTDGLEAPLVGVDNEGGAYQATCHLIELGHRRIGVITGIETISTLADRVRGYKRALREAGLPIDEALIVRADPRFYINQLLMTTADSIAAPLTNLQMTPNAFQALQHLLDLPDRPTALFVTNNQMILGTLHAVRQRQLRCPEDISLVSFDDNDWSPLFSPPLTAVRQPTYQLGQAAAKLLMKLIHHEQFERPQPFPVELIVRESCRKLTEMKMNSSQ